MELTLISTDHQEIPVDASRWRAFTSLESPAPLNVPIDSSIIKFINELSLMPCAVFFERKLDPLFIQEICKLSPAPHTPLFHLLAQHGARTYKNIFETCCPTEDTKIFTAATAAYLEAFLHGLPKPLIPYINCYFYLLFAHPDHVWLGEDLKNFVTTNSETFIATIEGLPSTKDQALQALIISLSPHKKERDICTFNHYVRYLLAIGANAAQKIRTHTTCHCCSESNHPQFIERPLIKLCKHDQLRKLLQTAIDAQSPS